AAGGAADRYTPPAETRRLYQAFSGPKQLWFIAGTGHANVGNIEDPAYRARLLAFLDATLGTK
ncbi:MAG TPA: hypothetical protein VF727_14960, partial [Allosphingosinicella sp.]